MDGEGMTEGEGRRLLGDHWQAGHVTGDDWHWYRTQSHDTIHTHTPITYCFKWCNLKMFITFLQQEVYSYISPSVSHDQCRFDDTA